ncbi:hypothetical protein HNY73_009574 [Argiope bruennichi]|uniref:Uncharacterized protein n=1 Tax=Argiope bruennichi TaxID=94029 RepID=A0A8T0F9X4_ARGBR|nr:hypothetical protein HNY73_009574 [Argiope bruennichi]
MACMLKKGGEYRQRFPNRRNLTIVSVVASFMGHSGDSFAISCGPYRVRHLLAGWSLMSKYLPTLHRKDWTSACVLEQQRIFAILRRKIYRNTRKIFLTTNGNKTAVTRTWGKQS